MSLDILLAGLIFVMVPFAWLSTLVLTHAARKKPRIGALTERATIAFVIAVFLTSASAVVLNTETGQSLFPIEAARVVFRVSALAIGMVPAGWVLLWFAGRLGSE